MNTAGPNDQHVSFFERGLLLGFILLFLIAATVREYRTIRSFEQQVTAGMGIASKYAD